MRCKFLIWTVLLLGLSASAANYFVDYSAGSDAALGTSTGTAWKHCPGDPSATGTAAAATLAPGDKVTLKGGVQYVLTAAYGGGFTPGINLNWNGSAGNPITYDGNSAGTWGTGRAIVTDNYATNYLMAFARASGDVQWVNFTNFEIGPLGGSLSLPTDPGSAIPRNPGIGIYAQGAMRNVNIGGCYFHHIGYTWNAKPMDFSAISGNAIQCIDNQNLSIVSNEFSHMNIGLELVTSVSSTNLLIAGNAFHDYVVWMMDFGILANGASLQWYDISYNVFTNYTQFDQAYWTGYGDWPHSDGIFVRADYTNGVWTNIFIHNNTWNNTITGGGGTACIYFSQGTSGNVYNNIFNNTLKTRTIFVNAHSPQASQQMVRIYNNTFLEDYQNCIDLAASSQLLGTVDWRNNIFYDLRQGNGSDTLLNIQSDPGGTFTPNYNDYWSFNTGGTWVYYTNSFQRFSFLQAKGYDLNSTTNNPNFVNITFTNGTLCNLNDFHLKIGSAAIGAGTNLSAYSYWPQFMSDRDGVARAPVAAWDMGAYSSVVTDPAITVQPTDQTVTQPATATFSVTATGTATLTYQWYKNGVLIAGATSASYTTPPTVYPGDNGSLFHCVVSGPGANSPQTSSDAQLTVLSGASPRQNTIGTATIGNATF